ncbi:retrovirus-related Pol polyprotein from transposon 17.6 [Trichonephila clavipes]|nr:retrovirus-related Pol polyprotein from transposon 17.6 [Trichonephila clavipes]
MSKKTNTAEENISEDYAKKELITRIARWALQLEEFDYEIEHRAGSRMKHVDALGRYPVMMTHLPNLLGYIPSKLCLLKVPSKTKQQQKTFGNPIRIISDRGSAFTSKVLTKLSLDDSTKWYKYVDRLQRILNSTISRSTKWTPFELLVGIKMRNKEDILIKDLLLEEMAKELLEQREFLRNDAKRTSKPCSLKIERRITEEERKLRYTKKK